jgi:hypothetical protein
MICRLRAIQAQTLVPAEVDAIDGTPVIDIKPVMREYLPCEDVIQPPLATEPMREYSAARPNLPPDLACCLRVGARQRRHLLHVMLGHRRPRVGTRPCCSTR